MAPRRVLRYEPGDLIYSGKPFVHAFVKDGVTECCENCCEELPGLKFCQRCLFAQYCSRSCQKEAWRDHKVECGILKNLPPQKDWNISIRLMGKLIMKIKGKCWKSISEVVEGKVYSFADKKTDIEELKKDSKFVLFCKEFGHLVKQFIGSENMPPEDDFYQIVKKVMPFQLGWGPYFKDCLSSFYLGLIKIEHACIPNASLSCKGKYVKVRAISDIYDDEAITISCKRVLANADRDFFSSSCCCKDCTVPYGESVLRKVIDETKAYSTIQSSESLLKYSVDNFALIHSPDFSEKFNITLKMQEGVLADTHILHLRLLSFKCHFLKIPAWEIMELLEELLIKLRFVFGEYHEEVRRVYYKLMLVYFSFDRFRGAARIIRKLDHFRELNFEDTFEIPITLRLICLAFM